MALEPLLQDVLNGLDPEIREKQAQVDLAGPWPDVQAHPATVSQAFANLIGNALKFTRPDVPVRIRIRTEPRGEMIRVWVEDNGIGIAPQHQEKIFNVFTRLHGPQYTGTGIGLAIVQQGIARLGGRTGVESALNQGSRFWFELRRS